MPEWFALGKKHIPVKGACPAFSAEVGHGGAPAGAFQTAAVGKDDLFCSREGLIAGSSFLPSPLVRKQKDGGLCARGGMPGVGEF